MYVRMIASITGTRNGQEWPPRNEVFELPDEEAREYIQAGYCVPEPRLGIETTRPPIEAIETRRLDPVDVANVTIETGSGRTRRRRGDEHGTGQDDRADVGDA